MNAWINRLDGLSDDTTTRAMQIALAALDQVFTSRTDLSDDDDDAIRTAMDALSATIAARA